MGHLSRFLEPSVVERLNQLQLTARSVAEGNTVGQHRSPIKGASIDFRQHRFYVPGDEPRRLDWRLLARTDRHYIKEYDEETNLRSVILLDRSGSMAYGKGMSKFDYATRLTAALSYLMLGRTESVGVGVFAKQIQHWLPMKSGINQLSRITETLDRVIAHGESDPARAMHQAADRLDRRALVIIISDFFAPWASIRRGLARLRHDGHEVIGMRVLHSDEIEFPFQHWTRFDSLELERSVLVETAVAKQLYQRNFKAHLAELEKSFQFLRSELTTFTTDKPLIDALTGFVRQRVRA